MTTQKKVLRLTESAIMLAFATILSEISLKLPFGGTITAFAQLPIIIIAYRYGTSWGLFTGAVHGLFQLLLGMDNLRYATSGVAVAAIIVFDYLLAFTALGLGGIFRGKFKKQGLEMAVGGLVASAARLVCHIIVGFSVWRIFAPEGQTAIAYSISYNSSYMIPEAILTFLGALLICAVLDFSSENITRRNRPEGITERCVSASVAKVTSICAIAGVLLYDIFTLINSYVEEAEVVTGNLFLTTGITIAVAMVIYLLAEMTQMMYDKRGKQD